MVVPHYRHLRSTPHLQFQSIRQNAELMNGIDDDVQHCALRTPNNRSPVLMRNEVGRCIDANDVAR